jgi:hypothetical protein
VEFIAHQSDITRMQYAPFRIYFFELPAEEGTEGAALQGVSFAAAKSGKTSSRPTPVSVEESV